jgi:uncharacterized protein (TIGR02679 family)
LIAALDVAVTLPREPVIELSTLATELLGDPHALDDGTSAGDRLVALLSARDVSAGVRLAGGERRALLGRFGVLCDPASATVLTLGLRPVGDSPLEQARRVLSGSHVVVTLGQLMRSRPRFERGILVRLCENPAVVLRAEDRLGAGSAPVVCTGGWPGSAVCALLDQLRDRGAKFEHHGDFDWEGWRSPGGCVITTTSGRGALTLSPTAGPSQPWPTGSRCCAYPGTGIRLMIPSCGHCRRLG